MNDEPKDDGAEMEDADFVLEEEEEDLETAFREALEAVERREGEGGNGSSRLEIAEASEQQPEEAAPSEDSAAGVVELQEELGASKERLVRALADFDNFRKRTERERSDLRRYEGFEILRELVGIVDNLELALEADGSTDDLKAGVGLILRQIRDLLERRGVERIATEGEPFDPRVHEAMMQEENPDVGEPTVDAELQAGYTMRDRLLRPARVKVAMPPEGQNGGE